MLVATAVSGTARAEWTWDPRLELGVTAGVRIFADDNELGRRNGAPDTTGPNLGPAVGVRLGLAPLRLLTIEGEAIVIPASTDDGSTDIVAFALRGHLLVHLLPGTVRPFLLVGAGVLSVLSSSDEFVIGGDDVDKSTHFGLGVKWEVTPHWGLRLDGRGLLVPSTDTDSQDAFTVDYEVLVGAYFSFGGREPPAEVRPEPAAAPQPGDRDGDGILDDTDRCPAEGEDKDGWQDEDGCPDGDDDGDNIPDAADKCPRVAGIAENSGCPDADADGDGLVDRLDKCPNEAETKNGYEDADGCADQVPEAVKQFTGVIQGIQFETGKAKIRTSSFAVLDKAVQVLKEYPSVRMEIQGHTDSRGTAEFNRTLSQQRAEAVRDYFVSQGIDATRLQATGYGPDKPIADNRSNSGRTQNRRVEFQIIQGN
jgi:OmpA-OmpF porin, OOP family